MKVKDNLKKDIESRLNTLEVEASSKIASTLKMKKNIKEVEKFINSSIVFAASQKDGFTADEVSEFYNRLTNLNNKVNFFVIPSIKKASIKTKVAAGATIAGLAIAACSGLSSAKGKTISAVSTETEVSTETNDLASNIPVLETETVTYDSMSDHMVDFSNTTVNAIDDAMNAGINLSVDGQLKETDKETYAKVLTDYRIVANMDDFSNLEYAELFGENSNPTEDLVTSFFKYNSELSYQLVRVNSNTTIDYNNLYNNDKDAEVLNESQRLIVNINESTTKEDRLEASKNWYSYVVRILTEQNIALTPQALDTLIKHSEAYDDLTRNFYEGIQGAYIDDELEHYFNVSKDACLNIQTNDEGINVQEYGIENLESVFRISYINKLNTKYDDALKERELQLTLGNALNQYNSYNNIISYVSERVDLSKFIEAISHVEFLENLYGINDAPEKSKDDSGVSDGNGGNISKEDMKKKGAKNKKEYEEKVKREEKKKEDDSKRVTDEDGEEIKEDADDTKEEVQESYAEGYRVGNEAGSQGKSKPAHKEGNTAYNNGLDQGYKDGLEVWKASQNDTKDEYKPVDNGGESSSESNVEEHDYTEPATPAPASNNESNSTNEEEEYFEPVEDSTEEVTESEVTEEDYVEPVSSSTEEVIESEVTEEDYVQSNYSVQNELDKLTALRDFVMQYSVQDEEKVNYTK